MKILSIITTFTTGGAEVLVSNLSGAFATRGHRSLVVALCPARLVRNSKQAESEMREKIEAAGGSTGVLTVRDRRNLIAGAAAMRALLRREQPDIIHAHTIRAVLLLKLAGASAPIVATHHNSRLSFHPLLFRALDPNISSYVGISDECCRMLQRQTRGRVVKIVNATGPGFLVNKPRTMLRRPTGILAVGALTAQKNYGMMIDAVIVASRTCPEYRFKLRIAGDGALRRELQQRIDAAGARNVVELLGTCSNIPDLMRASDIFINTSHYEGMPIAMLEALQSALPVIGTDVAGTRELIRDGEDGLLTRPDDPLSFAKALCSILGNPSAHARMSAAALAEGSKYRLDYCGDAHLTLYESTTRNLKPRAKGTSFDSLTPGAQHLLSGCTSIEGPPLKKD